MEGADKRSRDEICELSPFEAWHDPAIPAATRTFIRRIFVDVIFFCCSSESLRRSIAYNLYHVCRAFRNWPIIHRLLCHTIADPLSDGMRECKNWPIEGLFPKVKLNGQHWWWSHRLAIFNEALQICFEPELYHPGRWKELDLTEFPGCPFRFVHCSSVRMKRVVDGGCDEFIFWEAPDGASMILFTYAVLRFSMLDFVVVCNTAMDRVIFRVSGTEGFQYWYKSESNWDPVDCLRSLFWDNEDAFKVMMEAWTQDLSWVGKMERFVDRWFTRTPQEPIVPAE